MIIAGISGLSSVNRDVCVVGGGPVGISLSLELARLGCSVLLLESGDIGPSADVQQLADAVIETPKHHVSMDIAVQRRLGGASHLWGGRCVPMDAVDFMQRPVVLNGGWPIGFDDVACHYRRAADYLGCGEPDFEDALACLDGVDDEFAFNRLERWSAEPRTASLHAEVLRQSSTIEVCLRATVVGLELAEDGRIARLRVRSPDGADATIAPRCVVLAAGGIECARLLLAAQRDHPGRFGGDDGPLGRYYMGHLYGSVAEMTIDLPAVDASIEYYLSRDCHYIRRRFTPGIAVQQRLGLSNVALWPDYPSLYDPVHRNGILSLAYLALSVPWAGRMIVVESIRRNYLGPGPVRRLPHISNLLRDAPNIACFVPQFLYRRYLTRPRMPGFFQRNAARRYAIRFHAEHLPDPDSRVVLTRECDALGLPKASVSLHYRDADTAPLIRAHEAFAGWLQRTRVGSLTWSVPEAERSAHIISQCYDGHHQIGTTRMAVSPRTGVVDQDCRVFGSANLFIAGSAVFPTSGAANPTLTATALAVRLAASIRSEVRAADLPAKAAALG